MEDQVKMQNELTAALVTLGCPKNMVDSEVLAAQLAGLGYRLIQDPSQASLLLVNTCGFLEEAVEEAVNTILELAEYKKSGRCRCLVVAGCMVQRYGKKLPKLLPEVDLFMGTGYRQELAKILAAWHNGDTRKLWIARPLELFSSKTPRLRCPPFHYAYVKIAEGCGNECSFCLIPKLRGPYRSRTVEDVADEVSVLAQDGAKEINLIAQDITSFGLDRGDRSALIRLLERLDNIAGIQWIRLLYTYPDRISDALLRTIYQSKKIVHYLDVPLQHCVPKILEAMRRGGSSQKVEALIERIRFHVPDIALRTSLMVGFPGETARDFHALLRFVEKTQFDHLGVFCFSPERGSAAAKLPEQIDSREKERRRQALLELQKKISRERLKKLIGTNMPVLVEGYHPETELLLVGRTASQAPEVDGHVIITKGRAEMGSVQPARITKVHDYDLEAELTDKNAGGGRPPARGDLISTSEPDSAKRQDCLLQGKTL